MGQFKLQTDLAGPPKIIIKEELLTLEFQITLSAIAFSTIAFYFLLPVSLRNSKALLESFEEHGSFILQDGVDFFH